MNRQPIPIPESLVMEQEVILLDGRAVLIKAANEQTFTTSDAGNFIIHLAWLNTGYVVHKNWFKGICNLAATHSLTYLAVTSRGLKIWNDELNLVSDDEISINSINLLSKIPSSYHPFIVPFLRRQISTGLKGIDEETREFLLKDYKWEEKGNGSYFSLITNDPECGALTDQELHSLHTELNYAFSTNKIDISAFALTWMFIATGLRPIQIARMKVKDVQILEGPEGKEVNLRVPLAKGEQTAKQSYWWRRAPSVLAEILITYIEQLQLSTEKSLFEGVSSTLSNRITTLFDKLNTWSDRLESTIPITPYRFRYTFATRALRQGASDMEVARLLTHRSTSCIQFYRASMPELQEPIREKIGQEMDYFARAFRGKLIADISEATQQDKGASLIRDFMHLTGQQLGACGTQAKCYQNAPIACLTCSYFEPFREAPWNQLLSKLEEDQSKEREDRIKMITQNAIDATKEIISLRDLKGENTK
ncbi:tyrosine-type recombinase/integrase [Cellvibrio sp.]|uniref:tyrosine-type recombinase/integrase n=1 Tax=Cellvibrio sp. TaxID=1965322 RepID=UPI0039647DBA